MDAPIFSTRKLYSRITSLHTSEPKGNPKIADAAGALFMEGAEPGEEKRENEENEGG